MDLLSRFYPSLRSTTVRGVFSLVKGNGILWSKTEWMQVTMDVFTMSEVQQNE